MDVIQVTKPDGWKIKQILDILVTVLRYNEIIIYHAIYNINLFYYGTVSHLTVSTDYVLNTNNIEIVFTELRRFLDEDFDTKFQEGCVLKYLDFLIFCSPISFSIDQNYHIM